MLMQLNLAREAKKLVVVVLALVFGLLISWAIVLPPDSDRFVGVCLIVGGALYIALHRWSGRSAVRLGPAMPLVSGLWTRLGREGAQAIYLGIGILLLAVGGGLLIAGFVRP
jgi:hypothetical protein